MDNSEAERRAIEAALLKTDPSDVDTIELLKNRYKSLGEGPAPRNSGPRAPTAPKPVEGSGGAAFGVYPAAKGGAPSGISEEAEQGLRTAGSVIATAPAKGLAGMVDLAGEGAKLGGRKMGLPIPDFPHLTPEVENLTNTLAGKKVPESVLRSAVEGATMAPMFGGPLVPGMVSGAVGGGTAELLKEKGAHPAAQVAGGVLGGVAGGKAASLVGRGPSEILASGSLRSATAGLTQADLRAGVGAARQAQSEGVQLLPSQTLPTGAPGLEALQGALLKSRATGAEGFRTGARELPEKVQALAQQLRGMGGQAPRSDDLLAQSVQRIADEAAAAGPKAINQATRPLYDDPAGATRLSPKLAPQIEAMFAQAIDKNVAKKGVPEVLAEAQGHLLGLFKDRKPTVSELADAIESVKRDLPAYTLYPKAANYARSVVGDALAPLEELVGQVAPARASAPKVQAQLRADLPPPFNETMRQAGTTTGTEGALKAAVGRPEVLGAVEKANPRVAQELLQRHLDQAFEKAFAANPRTGLPPENAGITLRKALTEGLEGKSFDQNLSMLLPGNPQAQEGFRRVAEVMANASRPTGGAQAMGEGLGLLSAGTRGAAGSPAQRVGVVGLVTQKLWGDFRDNATIRVLQRPDVMERLAYIASLPKPRLTPQAITAAVPQLFEESQK